MTTELEIVAAKVDPWPDKARALTVEDQDSYDFANNTLSVIRDLEKEVGETFDPICAAAHKAHKEATAGRAKHLKPLEDAKAIIAGKIRDFEREQKRLAAERQRLIDEEAKRLRDEETARQIAEAQAAGAVEEELLDMIEFAPPPVAAPVEVGFVKAKGNYVRTALKWKARITNKQALLGAVRQFPQLLAAIEIKQHVVDGIIHQADGKIALPGVVNYQD